MKGNEFPLLICNIMMGLSFLAEGIDRAGLIGLGIAWLIIAIIRGSGE